MIQSLIEVVETVYRTFFAFDYATIVRRKTKQKTENHNGIFSRKISISKIKPNFLCVFLFNTTIFRYLFRQKRGSL